MVVTAFALSDMEVSFASETTAVMTYRVKQTVAAREGGKSGEGSVQDNDAEAAALFYAESFPDIAVSAALRAPSVYPGGKKGDVLTVEFTGAGVAFSFQVATDDQQETARCRNAIVGNGGRMSECGWCEDRWSLSWPITPRVLTEALAAGVEEARKALVSTRFNAMLEKHMCAPAKA